VAAFLSEVPVAHVEAGLRTYASEPFPEEALRRMIACVARWHFCPDEDAAQNVANESGIVHSTFGAEDGIYVVGNTINDTLPKHPFRVLATLHRRENWGDRIWNALEVLSDFQCSDPEDDGAIDVIAVRHPNWEERYKYTLVGALGCEPLDRSVLLEELQLADVVVTDSGGLQEECAFLSIPCIVFRTATERTALLENGAIELVHPDRPEELRAALDRHLQRRYTYGRGDTSEKIAKILMEELNA
jgi:UDP-N-acetylglucosamine 2-epimerase (non-hydrolysing)